MSDTFKQAGFGFLTSSAAVSPAKTLVSREPVKGSAGSGRGFGKSSLGSFLSFDLDSLSWKTSPLCDGEVSESFSGTFPRAGTMRRGIACPQAPSAPLTGAIGSSWSRGAYPTPSATNYGISQNEGKVEHHRPATAGTPSLETWAKAGGPEAVPKGPAWPTPLAKDSERIIPGTEGNRRTVGLASMARERKLWPTPTSGDEKRSGSRVGNADTKAHPGTSLTTCRSGPPARPTCAHGESCRLTLNPRFVLWLMGFPLTWFDPHFARPETLSLFPSGK